MRQESDFLDGQTLGPQGFPLDTGQFGTMGIDTLPFDYGNQLVSSIDSPNFNMDYNQVFKQNANK